MLTGFLRVGAPGAVTVVLKPVEFEAPAYATPSSSVLREPNLETQRD
jgi:hypothetical protein